MVEPKYKRILIKLSGEALAGERGVGIDIKPSKGSHHRLPRRFQFLSS